MFWSVIVGVLLSRGEKDTAIHVLIKMENIDNSVTFSDNKNKFNKFKSEQTSNNFNNENNDNPNVENNNNNNNNNDNNDNDINVNMNDINKSYKKNFGINKPRISKNKKPYKGPEVAQTVELGILYALDGSLPLLTKNGEKALIAMDLIRLLPKQENSDGGRQDYIYSVKDIKTNSNVKSTPQSQSLSQNQNIDQNTNEKMETKNGSKKIHNLDGISEILDRIPKELRLSSADLRTVCTIGDVLGFLECCRGRDEDYNKNNGRIGLKIENFMSVTDYYFHENSQENNNKKKKNLESDPKSYDENDEDEYSAYVRAHKRVRADKEKVPVGIALLQSLFGDAINDRKYSQAARIIRLLEGSRLVIDLDAPSLAAVSSLPLPLPLPLPPSIPLPVHFNEAEKGSHNGVESSDSDTVTLSSSSSSACSTSTATSSSSSTTTIPSPPSTSSSSSTSQNDIKVNNDLINAVIENPHKESAVKIVRETLARRWAAMLIASSLNKLKSNVAGSVKMLAALQYLQKEEKNTQD